MLLFVSTESRPVKHETSQTVILPLSVSVLCLNILTVTIVEVPTLTLSVD